MSMKSAILSEESKHVGEDSIELSIEACSMVYASPLVLRTFQNSGERVKEGMDKAKLVKYTNFYNPFKEDVYSLGLTLL